MNRDPHLLDAGPGYVHASVPRFSSHQGQTVLVQQQAFVIADEASRCDIEMMCPTVVLVHQSWYDTRQVPDHERECIARAVAYLEARGDAAGWCLVRSQSYAGLIRFQELPQ